MLSVGIIGASGFTGAELLRLCAAHPEFRVELTATAYGEPIYRSRGFAPRSDLAMRWVQPRDMSCA